MDIKEIAGTLIRGNKNIIFPLKYSSLGTMIVDNAGNHILDIRGWGRIQYFGEGAEELQDAFGEWVVKTLNESWEREQL